MKNLFICLINLCFGIILLLSCSCHDEVIVDCTCNEDEICLYDECYLSESVHYIGGTTVIAPNSYVGTAISNQCVDTLIFFNDTNRTLENGRFGLIVADHLGGIQNVAGSFPTMVSSNEYYLTTVAPLCYLNGEAWYADMHFIIEPNNVWMNLNFWTLNSEPGVYVDSCIVTFYKKP